MAIFCAQNPVKVLTSFVKIAIIKANLINVSVGNPDVYPIFGHNLKNKWVDMLSIARKLRVGSISTHFLFCKEVKAWR